MADKKQDQKEKRNAKGGGSVRQRANGRWEARCTINGKVRSFYADKQADALKLMRDAKKNVDDQTYVEPSKLTVGQWLDIWLEEYTKKATKSNTYFTRKRWIKNHIKPGIGKIKLQSLTTLHLQKFYNDLLDNKGLSRKSLKTSIHCSIVSCALKKAVKLGYITQNPAVNCTIPKPEKREMIVFSKDEIAKFLKLARETEPSPYKELFEIALFTGMRLGEICGLTWDEINFSNGTITIKHQLQFTDRNNSRQKAYIETPKNHKVREIIPAPFVMKLLKKVHYQQLNDKIQAGTAWKNEKAFVFTNPLGEFLISASVRARFKNLVAKMEKPDMRFHDLRHTYAVMALQAGDDPKTVQENLGHATATFTLETYAHITEDMRKDSSTRMQKYYYQFQA